MPGYKGNILVIYDIRNPARPTEVSRWWLPGQHIAGGEKPTWSGRQHRLHHALRVGNKLWAGCWHGGVRIVDIADPLAPQEVGYYIPEPAPGQAGPQTNDVDSRGIIYLVDRGPGLNILEFKRPN